MGSFIVWVLRQLLREEYEEVESFWMVLGGVEVNSAAEIPKREVWEVHELRSRLNSKDYSSSQRDFFLIINQEAAHEDRPNVRSLDYPLSLLPASLCIIPMPRYEPWSSSPALYQNAIANPKYVTIMPTHRTPIDHHEDEGPSGEWTPFGCCSRSTYGHPPIAYQQRSIAAGPVEYPPYPGSLT